MQGIARSEKQWQHQGGQLHSEQRKRHPTRPELRQQNHSPEVVHPTGHPPPCAQVLHVNVPPLTCSQVGTGEKQSLHGPPPHPTHPFTDPSDTPVRVRKRPAPSEPAPIHLKNCRRDDFPASLRAAAVVTSIATG